MPEADKPDDLVARAELTIAENEAEAAEVAVTGAVEAQNPENKTSDKDMLSEIKELMDKPGMSTLCGLVITNWRVFAVLRQEMERAAGKLRPELFSALMQGLSTTALEPFSIVDMRRDVKKVMLPWVSRITEERTAKSRGGKKQ